MLTIVKHTMSDSKDAILVYLAPEITNLVKAYGNQNNLIISRSIEKILRQFFLSDNFVEQTAIANNLNERIGELSNKLFQIDKITCCQVEALESIEKRLAVLEYQVDEDIQPKVLELAADMKIARFGFID